MIADNLPEAGLSIEDCVMQVMANLAVAYADELDSYQVPFIEDPAIEGNNLAGKYCYNDFAQFVDKLNEHLSHLADEGTGNSVWKQILGNNFPSGGPSCGTTSSAKSKNQQYALSVQHRQPLGFPMQLVSQMQQLRQRSNCLQEKYEYSKTMARPYRRAPLSCTE